MSAAIAGSGIVAGRALQNAVRCSRQQFWRVKALSRSFHAATRRYQEPKRYTKDHEWVQLQGGSPETARIGISTYAAKALGDVVYVELPTVDTAVSKGDTIGAVESVKSASDILTPVSGTIQEVNGVLEDSPGVINASPEQDGWLATIKVTDASELQELMDDEGYRKFTEAADADSEK